MKKLRSGTTIPTKNFLTDETLYNDTAKPLCVMTILDKIAEETKNLPGYTDYNKKRKADIKEKKKADKKQKLEEMKNDPNAPKCVTCSTLGNILHIFSKACDGNHYVLPNGKEGNGYLPTFGGLTDGDGLMIEICVSCGTIQRLNLAALKEDVRNAEKDLEDRDRNEDDSSSEGDSSNCSDE